MSCSLSNRVFECIQMDGMSFTGHTWAADFFQWKTIHYAAVVMALAEAPRTSMETWILYEDFIPS